MKINKDYPEQIHGMINTKLGKAERNGFAFSDVLLNWYHENRRILPWREEPTAYHVWLSEIMLQQTRVEAVKSYYERFLREIPSIKALSETEEDRYLKLWEGLGYYSRVRNLHRAAVQIMEEYEGRMPQESKELLKVSGIGPYTAAAVASIAFGERIPAVDGNLLRCFARITAYRGSIKDSTGKNAAYQFFLQRMPEESRDEAEKIQEVLLSGETTDAVNSCGEFNQALMDLGAMVCTPNGIPKCMLCPFSEVCEAHEMGKETEFPLKEEKKPRKIEEKTVFLIRRSDVIALRKRPKRGLLAGLYEFPNAEGHLNTEQALSYVEKLGFSSLRIKRLPDSKHIFTHKEWNMIAYEIHADELTDFPREEMGNEVFLTGISEIKEHYSIPSAFSAYLPFL